MDTSVLGHLVLKELVDDAMAGGLHLGLESVGGDDQSEMGLLGGATHHGLVVGVLGGVVEDLQARRFEGVGYLSRGKDKSKPD